ncbi:MAG: Transcriptional regulatory protein CusR [Stenotrophomonas maltophilia]|uniref:Transcriptional regulatory protein CusR n=1 Tax=Stenotrophomonas maltophilia TaxID=40324 RepID=A0A7V8FHG2_STEMA|nr:MAG: Transcriptional regulatory protein CusR [Stenotrophomonas maltophilia]
MDTLRLLDLEIDRPARRFCRDGQPLPVNGLSWTLLEVLLAHGTDVVEFDTLAAQVWAPAVVGEDAVSQRVKLLRQALGDDSRQPRYIRSVRGRGYQLCAAPKPMPPATGALHLRRGRAGVLAGGIAVVALLGTVLLWPRARPGSPAQPLLQRAAHYAEMGGRKQPAYACPVPAGVAG